MLRVLYCDNRSCGKQIKPVVIGGKVSPYPAGFMRKFCTECANTKYCTSSALKDSARCRKIFRILFRAGLRRARVSKLPQACPRCLHCKTRWLAAMNPLPQLLRIAKTFSLAGSGSSGSGHLMRAHQSAHAQH